MIFFSLFRLFVRSDLRLFSSCSSSSSSPPLNWVVNFCRLTFMPNESFIVPRVRRGGGARGEECVFKVARRY